MKGCEDMNKTNDVTMYLLDISDLDILIEYSIEKSIGKIPNRRTLS